MRSAICVLVAIGAMAVTTKANATAAGPAGTVMLTLDVEGTIPQRCTLDIAEDSIRLTLGRGPGSRSVPVSIDCNDRMAVSIKSDEGGLLHSKAATMLPNPGFDNFLPYDLALRVPSAGATLRWSSRDIKDVAETETTNRVPGIARGELDFSWAPRRPLIGGDYADHVEIRVSAAGETNGP